ncbi:GatB/YqeY [Candidatus Saccharibacteria bacterium]|nr:MAG: GatB/YqeY [Candidatus Saccharibacteria bacterium]
MAALKQRISDEMKAALLGGDRFRGDVLRGIKASILNEEVAKGKREAGLDDAEVEALLTRELKKRRESAEIYHQNGRQELAEKEEQEMAILKDFLPEQMSEADISKMADEIIAEIGATGPQQMGQVIGAIKAKAGATADGATVAKIVKEKLTK